MKKILLTGVAVLFLATGTAHAQAAKDNEATCYGTNGDIVSCDELGYLYHCDDPDDEVYVRHDHLLSDLSSHTITVYTRTGSGRKYKNRANVYYNIHTDTLSLNGKRCKKTGEHR
jgi:hypothetical protein